MGKIILIPILLSLLVLPIGILADEIISIENPLTATSFEAIVGKLIDFTFSIALVLVPLMIIIGGALLMTAAGNVARVDQAKRLILWTVVGFAIVLLAKGILAMIEQVLGVR